MPGETEVQSVVEAQTPTVTPSIQTTTVSPVATVETIVEDIKAVEPQVDKIAEAVNAWIVEHICNSPASRDVTVYNHIIQGKDRLIQKIKEVL